MNRREVIAGLLFAAMMERAQAQRTSEVHRIAFVDPQTAVAEQRDNPLSREFFEELRRLGYVKLNKKIVATTKTL
jgi:hypothetical protein